MTRTYYMENLEQIREKARLKQHEMLTQTVHYARLKKLRNAISRYKDSIYYHLDRIQEKREMIKATARVKEEVEMEYVKERIRRKKTNDISRIRSVSS